MRNFIKLTDYCSGETVAINAGNIDFITPLKSGGSTIHMSGDNGITVKEPLPEVLYKILCL